MSTTLVKANSVTAGQMGRLYNQIRLCNQRRDLELSDMTRSFSCTSHSYTSLRDVVDASIATAYNRQRHSHSLGAYHSLPDIRHVHMKNPLLEKAARAYLSTASFTQYQRQSSSSSLSSFLKRFQLPFQTTQWGFHSIFGGASAWLKQLKW